MKKSCSLRQRPGRPPRVKRTGAGSLVPNQGWAVFMIPR
jgi:hypothetical protein